MIELRIRIEENGKPTVPMPFPLPKAPIMVNCDVFGKENGTENERQALHQLIDTLVHCKHAVGAVIAEEVEGDNDTASNNN